MSLIEDSELKARSGVRWNRLNRLNHQFFIMFTQERERIEEALDSLTQPVNHVHLHERRKTKPSIKPSKFGL